MWYVRYMLYAVHRMCGKRYVWHRICAVHNMCSTWYERCRARTVYGMCGTEYERSGSRTEPEPEFYKPVLRYFCRTLTEPEPIEKAARSVKSLASL